CDVARVQSGEIVDTLANDFRPGAIVDPAARTATRDAVSLQLARAAHAADFASDDAAAKARQVQDVANARVVVDLIGDLVVSALGK
ncbi:MAG: hypothetical protein QOI98_3132, partial [Solirubrobacteraceae bacterium]|nr:hypothetical protein [Solirubrobacteraceae bacterium]